MKSTFSKNKLLIISFILVLIVFICLLYFIKDSTSIRNTKEFIKDQTKVLFVYNKENYNNYLETILKRYDIKLLSIDISSLNKIDKNKLKKITKSENYETLIIIYENGKIKDLIKNNTSEEAVQKFLQSNSLIPERIGNPKKVLNDAKEALKDDLILLYVPYNYSENIDNQDQMLSYMCSKQNVKYKKIDAYLLSDSQKETLNSLFQISEVNDQIVIFIKNQKVVGSVRGINDVKEYIDKLKEFKMISSTNTNFESIDLDTFNDLINSNQKSIIYITKDECKYCNKTFETLNNISLNNNVLIRYINIKTLDSDIANNVENKLISMGYSDGFTTPITIIVESNKLLDYVIGATEGKYFVEIFTKNGIIK